MVRSCPVVLAAAFTIFRAMCALLRSGGYAVCWRDSLGATVYDRAGRTSLSRLPRDEDVVVQSESAAWDVAITWSGLMWARAPQPWPACERAALMAGYVRAIADWVVPPPPARWARLMRAGGSGWPAGLSRPLADAGTLLHYGMGESACALAGPRLELLGRAVPVSVMDSAARGACPDVLLSVGTPPSLQGATPEVVLAPPATSRALFPGFTLQPLRDGPLLAFPAGAGHPVSSRPCGPSSPWRRRPWRTCRGRERVLSPRLATPTWAWSSTLTRTTSTSSAGPLPRSPSLLPPPPPPPGPDPASGGGGEPVGSACGRACPPPPSWAGIPGAVRPSGQDPLDSATPAGHDLPPPGKQRAPAHRPPLSVDGHAVPRPAKHTDLSGP